MTKRVWKVGVGTGFYMTIVELQQLIRLGEGFTTEFKQGGTTHLGRELCAFANSTGGVVLMGVTDDGKSVGVKDPNRLKSEVQNIARSIEPPLVVDIQVLENILVVNVPAQNSKPYSFGGKFYLRDGASSQQMSRNEIREFFFKEGVIHFDETPCERFSLEEDLTDDAWETFRKRAKIPQDMDAMIALKNLHLLKGSRMTHAGAWLLAKDIQKFNTSANVACALFMGTDKVRILDRLNFSGDIYSMIDSVVTYILSKINVELIIKHVKREERPELPEEALREAVVNALAHRDYRSTANVQIYIFKDRVEIVSPGGLPAGMTEADLGKKSIPRNPLLFGMLYRMEAVEHIGSGIKRIRQICENYGIAAPEIRVEENWFTVSFSRPSAKASELTTTEVTPHVTLQVTPQVTPQVERLLKALVGEMTRADLMTALSLKDRINFNQEYLQPAFDADLIEMTIPDKPRSSRQKYRLTEKGRKLSEMWMGGSTPQVTLEVTPQVTQQVTPQVERLIEALVEEMTRTDLMAVLSLKDRMNFSQEYLQPALELGLTEMTIPDKPRSSRQKYRLTEKGRKLAERNKG